MMSLSKSIPSAVGALCAVAAFLAITRAQLSEEAPPVRLQEQATLITTTTGVTARLELVNQSTKTVRGYVVLVEFQDSSGETGFYTTLTRVHPPHLPHGVHSFEPGESWTHDLAVPLENGNPVSRTLTMDHVVFEDGTTWGPDTERQSLKIQGLLNGFQAERSRLRRLLSEKGVQAVVEDLQQTP